MRQRITKQNSQRGGSMTWEMNSEDEGDSSQMGGSFHQAVPMYNPLHKNTLPAAPGSFPTSWQKGHHSSPDPFYQSAPRSLGVFKSDLPSLTPTFIPDSSYQTYLCTGRHVAKNRAKGGLPITKVCCAKFCAVYSFVAVGFLLFVGIIFDKQPLYIPGALPKHTQYAEGSSSKTQAFYSITPSVRLLPASNAYGAAFFYLITGCLCIAYAHDLISCYRRKSYQEIPDADSIIPTFHLPMRSSSKDYSLPSTSSPNRRRPYYQRGVIPDSYAGTMQTYFNRTRLYVASLLPTNDHRRIRKRKADPKEV